MSERQRANQRTQHAGYTFGDSALAAQRLDVLADVFDPATRAFLEEAIEPGPGVVFDLGCGPGRTTRLLVDVLQPEREAERTHRHEVAPIVGAERQQREIAERRRRFQPVARAQHRSRGAEH